MKKINNIKDAYFEINKLVDQMQSYFTNEVSYADRLNTINLIESDLSPLHAFINLFINYHDQVYTNSHTGYFLNGCHSSHQTGCFDNVSEEADLAGKLIDLAELMKLSLDNPISIQSLIDTIKSLELEIDNKDYIEDTCQDCDGNGSLENENQGEDEPEMIDCTTCNGSGWDDIENPNKGSLSENCVKRCELADDKLMAISDDIFISIANRIISNNNQ